MSEALDKIQDAYGRAPRKLDERLDKLARGDRGCLPDILSGLGAASMVVLLILSGMGKVVFSWVYAGVALWVGGFFLGSLAQAKSGKERRAALEGGPLVRCAVVDVEPHLYAAGKRAGRAIVVFRLGADAFGEAGLGDLAARATSLREEGRDARVTRLFDDEFCHEVLPLPDADDAYLADVVVHPTRLEGRRLDREAPRLAAIVDPDRGFIEHV